MQPRAIRNQAQALRSQGYSYSYISKKLNISKSTLSDWLTALPYTPNKFTIDHIGQARAASIKNKRDTKNDSLTRAKSEAAQDIGKVTKRDLMMLGLGLYLGEGGKSTELIRIVNSDPEIIQLSIAWFESLGVTTTQFAPRLHVYPDTDIRVALQYWSQVTRVPESQFQKSYIDIRTNKKKKKAGKLPHGTLHLTVNSGGNKKYGVFFFRKIMAWISHVVQSV